MGAKGDIVGDYKIEKVSMIGLGKLGLPIACAMASRGFDITGVDNNPAIIEAIGNKKDPHDEPYLEELLQKHTIHLINDIESATRLSDATFILVPTPSKSDGEFSLDYILPVCEKIGQGLREKEYGIVVVSSTVSPASTRGPIKECLEEVSGKKVGKDFGLCYNPEFVAIGDIIRGILNPDMVLIGESDEKAGAILEDFYKRFCENRPSIARVNTFEAELAKISVNTFITAKISFANLIARLCEKMPDADADKVTGAIGLDSRIGHKYLKGALPYGGPCFPRDNEALTQFAESVGVDPTIPEAVDDFNKRGQIKDIARLMTTGSKPRDTIGILGLSYKPDTPVIEESCSLGIISKLKGQEFNVVVYDPKAMQNAKQVLGDSVKYASSAEDCIKQSDVVVITTPWQEFKELNPEIFARQAKPRIVVDCWRILDPKKLEGIAYYKTLGKGE